MRGKRIVLKMGEFFEMNLRELSFKYLYYTLGIILMLEFIKLCFVFFFYKWASFPGLRSLLALFSAGLTDGLQGD